LFAKDCSAERQAAATQRRTADVDSVDEATHERLKACPLCRDEIIDNVEHLIASPVSELVWFDSNLKCGVKLTADDINSGNHPAACGTRKVRCSVSLWGKRTHRDMAMFKAVDVAAVVTAEHAGLPAFSTSILTMNCVVRNGRDLPNAVPTSPSVADLIGDNGRICLSDTALDPAMAVMVARVLASDEEADCKKAKVTVGKCESPVDVGKLSLENLRHMGAVQAVPMNNGLGALASCKK
jgi:hypothetical protein